MATGYLSNIALEQLDRAQVVIDRYVVSCAVCGTNQPYAERQEAEQVFARCGRLPRRTPGLTRPAAKPGFACGPPAGRNGRRDRAMSHTDGTGWA
jgi:hypothetical protein